MLNSAVLGLLRSRDLPESIADAPAVPSADGCRAGGAPSQLVDQLLADDRYALLLRPQISQRLADAQAQQAAEAFSAAMSEVPAGDVVLELWTSSLTPEAVPDVRAARVSVKSVFIDRFAVTNAQYQRFVDAGGYEQASLWHASVWPRVPEFVDSSGKRGPKFWSDGRHPQDRRDHPVVGVSWFEADAFARWSGKRLPCDGEWVKAAAWPATAGGAAPVGRRYPWGDTINSERANLWFTGLGETAPVTDFESGASAGKVQQMVGNVWEWTSSEFQLWVDDVRAELDHPLMSIRGGAFDTYFERLAGCQVQSGDSPLARRHNIGIRCAISACDVNGHAAAS